MSMPLEHKADALKLNADGYVDLFEVQLYPSGVMYMCPQRDITWQGNDYKIWGMRLTGVSTSTDDKTSRPKLSLANFTYNESGDPVKGIFSSLHAQNAVEGATVIRRRVLKANAEANANIKEEKRWKVARIASERPDLVVLELRNTLDGPRFTLPARKFNPPEFAQVKLY